MGIENGRESMAGSTEFSSTAPSESWFNTLEFGGDDTLTSSEESSAPVENNTFSSSGEDTTITIEPTPVVAAVGENSVEQDQADQLGQKLRAYGGMMDVIKAEEQRRRSQEGQGNQGNQENLENNSETFNELRKNIEAAAAAQQESIIAELNKAANSMTLSTLAKVVAKAEYLVSLSGSGENNSAVGNRENSKLSNALSEAEGKLAKLVNDIEKSGHAAAARIILKNAYRSIEDGISKGAILEAASTPSIPAPQSAPEPKAQKPTPTPTPAPEHSSQSPDQSKGLTMADAIRTGFVADVGDEGVEYMVAEGSFDESVSDNIEQWWANLPEPTKNKIIIYERGIKGSRLGRPLRDWLGANGYPEFVRPQFTAPTAAAA